MKQRSTLLAFLGVCGLASVACGQVIDSQDFEGLTYGGWLVNGNQEIYGPGNPGVYMGIPFQDFWGVTLRNDDTESPVIGNLTVHPNMTISVDFVINQLRNWFDEDMDPANFDLTLEFVDYGGDVPVSVYSTGPALPPRGEWRTYTWTIADTNSATLPAGWGGTGDEDPVTYEPRLPANRTFASVLASVDEVRVTTMKPGWFYIANFWQAGFDNVRFTVNGGGGPQCGPQDFNGDGDSGTDQDIEAFFACLGGSCCSTCWSGGADFNGDGDIGTDQDIEAFFRVLGGSPC
ncbi:MAG TPA: hypothetical protein VD997_09785 [Phycisphaerales bacterium]|nr:hypothetical protein [Phycisphaerales bacterium]